MTYCIHTVHIYHAWRASRNSARPQHSRTSMKCMVL